ncbi:MAG: cysteine--tRNA ligase [Patescibacteria group bacterium]
MSEPSKLKLYNTLYKKEEVFSTIEEGKVKMYTCGPTVYGRPHIGNYASFLMADLLRRWLEVSGYSVSHVKNITDVGHLVADSDEGEDKVEKQAKQEKKDPLEIAKKYEAMYLEDEASLNMLEPFKRPRATKTIKEMIELVKTLEEKGLTYEIEDGIYFSVEKFADYGKLSGNTLENLNAGARVEVKDKKKHPADFALWKKCVGENADHILRWDSPWGEGFPGWHIECSAMSMKFLGSELDIHTGGEDNIFPHHECEIAQSECATGKNFSRFWIHRRRIDMGSEKMSKSLGNVLSIVDVIAKGYSPLDLRYLFLSVHYRTNLKFSWKGVDDAKKARRKIMEWIIETGEQAFLPAVSKSDEAKKEKKEKQEHPSSGAVGKYLEKFVDTMNADLNTPGALAVVFDCMAWSRNQKEWSHEELEELHDFIAMVRHTFGCFDPEEVEDVPDEVQKLLDERQVARSKKDFEASDKLRDQICGLGWEVRDEGGGQEVRKL